MNSVNTENFLVSMIRSSNKSYLYRTILEAKECLKNEYEKEFDKVKWQNVQYGTKILWSRSKRFFLAWNPRKINGLYSSCGSVDLYERKGFDAFLQMERLEDPELCGNVTIFYDDLKIVVSCDQIEVNSRDWDPTVLVKDRIPDINYHRALRLKSSIDHISANLETIVLPL
jgi:hypothetical protein